MVDHPGFPGTPLDDKFTNEELQGSASAIAQLGRVPSMDPSAEGVLQGHLGAGWFVPGSWPESRLSATYDEVMVNFDDCPLRYHKWLTQQGWLLELEIL